MMAISIFDLIGVVLMGILGVALIQFGSDAPTSPAVDMLPFDIASFIGDSTQRLVLLGTLAIAFLLVKSAVSAWLSRRTLFFLARRQSSVTKQLTTALFQQPLPLLERRTTQETAYALTIGVASAIVGLLGAAALAVAEVTLLLILGVALLIYSPLVTIAAFAFFGVLALFLYTTMGSWAGRTGRELADATFGMTRSVQETISTYRELTASNRIGAHLEGLSPVIWSSARAAATNTFIAQLPKYIYETGLLIGAAGLAGWAFATQSLAEAVATITVFIAAGSRIMPSLLRLQNCTFTIRYASGQAQSTYALHASLSVAEAPETTPHNGGEFLPSVEFEHATFTYPFGDSPALHDVSLTIQPGMDVAVVGPTGSGKSTLVDAMLGILPLEHGQVRVSGMPPLDAVRLFPGAVGYLPQEVALVAGSVRTNVALGVPSHLVNDARVWHVLEMVRLADFLRDERTGLDTQVGERGISLSGGERQRIGLARALYEDPRLLILDEATSALDTETESAITAALSQLGGDVTRITVAHRLTTVRNADLVIYVDHGTVRASGTFEDVRRAVPEFDRSARLLGL
jgi:ABC-type multidrug transport system fused ATPase/permease subunit